MCVPVGSTTFQVLMFSLSFAKVNFFSIVNYFDPSKVGKPSYKACVRSRTVVKVLGCCAAGVATAAPEAARAPHATAVAAIKLFLTKSRRLARPYRASRQRGEHIVIISFLSYRRLLTKQCIEGCGLAAGGPIPCTRAKSAVSAIKGGATSVGYFGPRRPSRIENEGITFLAEWLRCVEWGGVKPDE